jgi:hypothetical protein
MGDAGLKFWFGYACTGWNILSDLITAAFFHIISINLS